MRSYIEKVLYNNEYKIICTYEYVFNKSKYYCNFYLYNYETCKAWNILDEIYIEREQWFYINDEDNYIYNGIMTLDDRNFFDSYINRFEEDIRLMNIGIEFEENNK